MKSPGVVSPGVACKQGLPHIMVPASYITTIPIVTYSPPVSLKPLPSAIDKLYIAVLKHKRKILHVEKGIKLYTIHLSDFGGWARDDNIVIGNIFA